VTAAKTRQKEEVGRTNNSREKIVRKFKEFPRQQAEGVKRIVEEMLVYYTPKVRDPRIMGIDGTFTREQLMSHDESR
jgi:hypothetical protein